MNEMKLCDWLVSPFR